MQGQKPSDSQMQTTDSRYTARGHVQVVRLHAPEAVSMPSDIRLTAFGIAPDQPLWPRRVADAANAL
jgi:hypothetical protein